MKIIIQRVNNAEVNINSELYSSISNGLLVLLGIAHNDNKTDCEWLINKILNLRIFDDEHSIMNKSLIDIDGELLIVSQFTLLAKTKKGMRPSYIEAAKAEECKELYNYFIKVCEEKFHKQIKSGKFGADMKINLCNDGPVTIIIDSKNKI